MIRNLYKTKTEAIFWGCMAIVLLVITFIHPRIIYPVLIVFCLISALVSFFKKKQKDAVRMRRDIVGNILGIAILCYVGQFLYIFFR